MGAVERGWTVRSGSRAVGRSIGAALTGTLARALKASVLVGTLALLGAVLLVAAPTPTPAAASARIPHDTLPLNSTVRLYPTYPNSTDANTPNGLASVGQPASVYINIPQICGNPCWTDQGFYIDLYVVEVQHEMSTCAASPGAVQIDRGLNGTSGALFYSGGTAAWPAAANSTANGSRYYAICTHVEIPPSKASQFSVPDYFTGGPADIKTSTSAGTNHIYEVISDYAPTATLSATAVAPGQTLTVTGHNWIPVYPDQPNTLVGVSLYEIPQAGYEIDFANTQPPVDATGSFTVSFPITAAYSPGIYYYAAVGSVNVNIFGKNGTAGALRFQVVASQGGGGPVGSAPPTATPVRSTASPTASTTATASPTATGTAGSAGITATTPPTKPGNPWPGILLASGATLLLGGGGAAWYFLAQTRKRSARMFGTMPEGQSAGYPPPNARHPDQWTPRPPQSWQDPGGSPDETSW